MEQMPSKRQETHTPPPLVMSKDWVDSLQPRTGMTPSRHTNSTPWIPFPSDEPVIPKAEVPTFSERRLEPHEWIELLEQTECLDYASPDVEACIEKHRQLEGDQELELTGREFVDSPAFPKLPSLNALSIERPTILKPILRPQNNVPRRPGLREKFPRQQPLMLGHQVSLEHKFDPGYPPEPTEAVKRSSSSRRNPAEKASMRSASRSLKFEGAQKSKTAFRRKRTSWSGQPSSSATTIALSRRQVKSARKSQDCVIPGCTKGARSRGLCKRHGGGKRCTYPECRRSDQGGGFCIAHGGGKRCATEGCKNSAQSRGLCKSHGGGKRCREEGCSKSSQAGGYCRGHWHVLV